jgi:signal transduction histidine kinase
LAGIIYFSAHFFAEALKSSKKKLMIFLNLIPISFISVLLLILFFKFIKISIKISNINLKYSIIYLGWLFLVLSISTFIIKMHDLIKNKTQLIFHMILISILFFFSYKLNILSTKLIIIYTIFYFLLVIHSHSKLKISKEKILIFDLVVLTLFIYLNIHFLENEKKQKIANNVLAPIILELEEKANSILKESIMKLEKEEKLIIEFFKNPKMDNLSFYLWKKTPLSNYNWNSGIEMLNEEGKEIARFSFNLPSYYLSEYFLPIETKWIVTSQKMHFLGKGKRLLIGYRDWFENGNYLGRLLIYLSIDYDTLPFPFNKNPYNELIRPFSYPSEYKIFNVVILDSKGSFIFNPIKLNTGISLQLLNPAVASSRPIWSTLTERDRKYSALIFKNKGRFYLILYQNKSLRKHIVDYIKLFLIYSIFFSLFISLYLIIAKKIKNPFQSFSRKVYLFFLVIAILPLLFFSFFTQKFFSYQFSEQFREKAEAHLSTAQSVMEDFLALQKERKKIYEIFPNDLVFWISTTINNDVNLYKKGILVSSSKRELFELGLLPKIINGQTFYNIYWENRPYDIRREKIGDLTFYILTVPTVFTNQIFLLSLPFPSGKEEISLASQELIEFLIFSSIFIIGIAIFLAQSMGRIILKPIKKLLNATEEVSKGNLEIKIEHYSKDEIQTLINGFNSMIENLKRQQKEIAEMSKKIAWTEMARRIAHEIKNPLTPILLSAEQILKVYEDKSSHLDKTVKESAEYIIREAEHLRKIAQEFLIFSKEEELKKEKFNLKEIITKEISPYKKTFQKKIKFIEIFPEKDVYIYADREKLKISLRNVIINSIEAIHKKGEIKIRVWIEKNWINIEISDTGEGIKKEFLEKIFEPYFSTKEGGTGLGLSIAKKIIEQHKGEIKISSEIGKGTITLIKLPTYL